MLLVDFDGLFTLNNTEEKNKAENVTKNNLTMWNTKFSKKWRYSKHESSSSVLRYHGVITPNHKSVLQYPWRCSISDAVSPACMWSTKRSAWGRCASRTSTGKVRVQNLEKQHLFEQTSQKHLFTRYSRAMPRIVWVAQACWEIV